MPPRWRGWSAANGEPVVTNARLSKDAKVQSRLFPKMHAWISLGTPLELLSPLSVLRVVYPLCAALWCVQVSLMHWPDERRGWIYAIAGAAIATWLGLLLVRSLGVAGRFALAVLGTAMVGGLIWASNGTGAALGFLPFFLPMSVFAAMFLPVRSVLAHLLVAVVLLWLAMSTVVGVGYAVVIALMAGMAAVAAPLAIVLLATAVARSGAIDPDTGLPNAVGLARRVSDAGGRFPIVLGTVHLAGIDEAREALGHGVGTELLRRAVQDLGQVLPPDTTIARVEGDELVVGRVVRAAEGLGHTAGQVPEALHAAGHDFARLLVDAVAAGRYVVGRVEVSLRAHVGLVFAPWDGNNLAELLRRGSLAARQASTSGRPVKVWEHAEGTFTADDLALLAGVRLAAERNELQLAFQPQVEARTGRTVSAEALLRWQSPALGEVLPGRFVELAERTGYIDRLTEWVLGEALDAQVRWRRVGLQVPVSVNFSAKTLRRPDLPTWVLGELAARALPPSALAIEVTETAATELLSAVRLLKPLHDRGIRVSIDDFGTGHTSLAVLPHLPLDELKVDMSFVLRSATSPADEAIVRSVLELAHRLRLDAVAEGVEDDDIRQRMTIFGYDLLQGFHFSQPLPEHEFVAFVRAPGRAAVVA